MGRRLSKQNDRLANCRIVFVILYGSRVAVFYIVRVWVFFFFENKKGEGRWQGNLVPDGLRLCGGHNRKKNRKTA